jgi:hypothetical protein
MKQHGPAIDRGPMLFHSPHARRGGLQTAVRASAIGAVRPGEKSPHTRGWDAIFLPFSPDEVGGPNLSLGRQAAHLRCRIGAVLRRALCIEILFGHVQFSQKKKGVLAAQRRLQDRSLRSAAPWQDFVSRGKKEAETRADILPAFATHLLTAEPRDGHFG